MDDTVKILGVKIVNSFLYVKRAVFVPVLSAVICSSVAAVGQAAAAERIRVGLATRDFGYLPLFVAIRAAMLALQQGVIHARPFNSDAAFVMKRQGYNVLAVLADYGPWPWGGYASSTAELSQEPAKVKRWTRAMVKSLLHMVNDKEDTIRIALQEFQYPREVMEEAVAVSLKAIDRNNPGGASDDSLRRNIEQTIAAPLNLKEQPPISSLVDFSVLRKPRPSWESGISNPLPGRRCDFPVVASRSWR